MKKIILTALLSFSLGTYCSDNIKETRGILTCKTKEGYAKNPHNLRIILKNTPEGIESYVLDTKTKQQWKIKEKPSKEYDNVLERMIDYVLPF